MRVVNVILWRLAESPVSYVHLVRFVRIQWPRVLPDAIGRVVCALASAGFIEVVQGRWQIRRGGPGVGS